MSVDFKPELGALKSLRPFVFWAQTTLPTVFDDSLSYYEVLTKLTKMVNTLLENTDTTEANVEALATAYDELQAYVNDYFENLDVTTEIDNKLEEWRDAGIIDNMVDSYVAPIIHDYLYGPDDDGGVQKTLEDMLADATESLNNALSTFSSDSRQALNDFERDTRDALTDFEDATDDALDAIPTTVDAWLDQNFTNPSSPPLDATLSLENAAAQSKATGERCDQLEDLVLSNNDWINSVSEVQSNQYVLVNNDGTNPRIALDASSNPLRPMSVANITGDRSYLISCVGNTVGPNTFSPAYAICNLSYDLQDEPVYTILDFYPRAWDPQVKTYEIIRSKSVYIPETIGLQTVNCLILMGNTDITVTPKCGVLSVKTDNTLTDPMLPANSKAVGDALANKLPWPVTEGQKDLGTEGKVLTSKGDGTTEWSDATDYDQEIAELQNDVGELTIAFNENTIKKEITGNGELFVLQGESVSDVTVDGEATSLTVRNTQIFEAKYPGTSSSYGVSITKNDDGSYTINGTATSNAWFHLNKSTRTGIENPFSLNGKYTITFEKISGSVEQESTTSSTLLLLGVKDGSDTSLPLQVVITSNDPNKETDINENTIYVENCIVSCRLTSGIKYTNYRFRLSLNKGDPLPWTPYKTPTVITDLTSDIASVANTYMPYLWMYTNDNSVITVYQVFKPQEYIDENIEEVNERIDIVADNIGANILVATHRGYHDHYPENTLWAFAQSKVRGFKYVETDVRFTSDGIGVLLHDESINRTARNADGTEISSTVNIADITYEQALQYDFGIYAGSQFAGTKIPTVEEFVAFCKNVGLGMVIETKVSGSGTYCANMVKKYAVEDSVIWCSFASSILPEITAVLPSAKIGLLSTQDPTSSDVTTVINLKTANNSVFLDYDYRKSIASILDSMIANDIGYAIYTLDSAVDLADISPYCFLIITNSLLADKRIARDTLDEWI